METQEHSTTRSGCEMDNGASVRTGVSHPAVIMIIEGRVPEGGQASLEEFFAAPPAFFDAPHSALMHIQWNAADGRTFRVAFKYATERDFEIEDIRTRTESAVAQHRARLARLLDAQPVITIWRESSRQFSMDLVRAYWDLVAAREWEALRAIVAPDVVIEWPASNERLAGVEDLIAANRGAPDGWTAKVRSVVGSGENVASDVEEFLDSGESFRVATFWTVRNQRIVRGTEYRTAVGQSHTPAWRRGHTRPIL